MTNEEHLAKIEAKCREILTLAEKRTPGKWMATEDRYPTTVYCDDSVGTAVCETKLSHRVISQPDKANAAWIAATAGSMESAARSTLIAINALRLISEAAHTPTFYAEFSQEKIAEIITAWPEEIL